MVNPKQHVVMDEEVACCVEEWYAQLEVELHVMQWQDEELKRELRQQQELVHHELL